MRSDRPVGCEMVAHRIEWQPAFTAPPTLLSSLQRTGGCTQRYCRRASRTWFCSLSEPFAQPGSVFDHPRLVFVSNQTKDLLQQYGVRVETPDLLGVVTWFVALYFGYSEKVRLGKVLQQEITAVLVRVGLGKGVAETTALALHTFPFLLAALLVDSLLRGSLGDSFAISGMDAGNVPPQKLVPRLRHHSGDRNTPLTGGLTLALWALIYELGRPKELSEGELAAEKVAWEEFLKFAEKRLERKGRCHFVEVAEAFRRQYPKYRTEKDLPDRTLRRFVAMWAPGAQRTKLGYYKELSVKGASEVF